MEGDNLGGRDASVLGVAAVEHAANATYHGDDLLAGGELLARAQGHDADRFGPEHPGERDTLRQAQAGVELGAV